MPDITTMSLILAMALGPARPETPNAPGLPPEFGRVTGIDRRIGCVNCKTFHSRMVEETSYFEKDGKQFKRIASFSVPYECERAIFIVNLQVYDATGQRLTRVDTLDRVRVGSNVLLSVDGQRVDRRYLGAIRPETLILVEPMPPRRVVSESPIVEPVDKK